MRSDYKVVRPLFLHGFKDNSKQEVYVVLAHGTLQLKSKVSKEVSTTRVSPFECTCSSLFG